MRRLAEKTAEEESGKKSIWILCERLKSHSFFVLNLLTVALWVSEETARLPRSFFDSLAAVRDIDVELKMFFCELSRSHGATCQIFLFASLFINLAGRRFQNWDGPRLFRSQRAAIDHSSH